MNSTKKDFKKNYLIGLLMFAISLGLYPYIRGNKAGSAYENPPGVLSVKSNTIEDLIIEAAGYYFEANSEIQKLLQTLEVQDINGIDIDSFYIYIDSAQLKIQIAFDTYSRLVEKAKQTPYNRSVLESLKQFSYDDYRIEMKLNKVLFDEVEDYLRNGKVTGVFERSISGLSVISNLLLKLKSEVSKDKVISISIAWEINEKLADMSLFGSYVARVFKEIN
jgi:hypothetical protein